MNNLYKLKVKTNSKINEYEYDFKQFARLRNFPQYSKNIFIPTNEGNRANTSISYCEGELTLNINVTLPNVLGKNAKAVVYHELTHILNSVTMLPEYVYDEKIELIRLSDEYTAVQNQMKCAAGWRRIDENTKFDVNRTINDGITSKKVKDYLIEIKQDYVATIKNLYNNKEEFYLYYIMLHTTYYISKIHFFHNFCVDNISSYVNNNLFVELFGGNFFEFEKMLRSIPFTDIEYFKALRIIQDEMVQHLSYKLNEIC